MINDDIYNERLKYTIANWSVNANNTASIAFQETNTTKRLTSDHNLNIDITSYFSPYDPWTNLIFNFSHVLLAINTDKSEPALFSITY